jgi:xanthine dehydrogenase small subunit
MADGHGSQCGFCTPGFVMSLFALYKNDPAPDRKCIDDALSGNLCRCTGYRPIVDAARNMYELGRALPDDVLSWLSAPAGRSCPRAVTDEGELVRTLEGLRRGRALRIKHAGGAFHAPRTLDELAALRAELPNARLLAGGTDIGLWVTKQLRRIDEIIYVGEVAELHRIVRTDTDLEIGAAATLSEASGALIADFPGIEAVLRRYASPPIRNAATIGGNIANGSPIGDSMPCLLALGARIALRSVGVRREMALEDFYLGYQKTALGADEFVEKILIPLPAAGQAFRAYKVSKRFDQDISVVCAAFCLTLSEGRVRAARIAFGGMAAVPQRAAHCEAALVGMSWSVDAALQASTALSVDFSPIDDMRGTAAYRMQVARNLLTRFYVEISDPGQATRVDSLELPVS